MTKEEIIEKVKNVDDIAKSIFDEIKDNNEMTGIYFSVVEILNSTCDILNELKRS